jgi:hypothetical protein
MRLPFLVVTTLLLAACETEPYTDSAAPTPLPLQDAQPSAPTSLRLSPAPSQPLGPAAFPEGVSYAGGDGSSTRQAVVVNGVASARASTRAEYAYLRNRYPGFKRRDQKLVRSAGRYYDALSFDLPTGESKTVYFDVTGTFGKR